MITSRIIGGKLRGRVEVVLSDVVVLLPREETELLELLLEDELLLELLDELLEPRLLVDIELLELLDELLDELDVSRVVVVMIVVVEVVVVVARQESIWLSTRCERSDGSPRYTL